MGKQERMAELRNEALVLHERACDPETNLVWGEGNLDSKIVIVGEAPGAEENKLGRPFVGKAGRLLNRELVAFGLSRDDIYITNVMKCRPLALVNGRRSNRAPTGKEIATWRDTLIREIEIVSPRIVLCLGGVAASTLIHPNFSLSTERGRWFDGPFGTKAIATFHPAYILRRQAYGDEESLQLFREDVAAVSAAIRNINAISDHKM
jgi:DNA polymerase